MVPVDRGLASTLAAGSIAALSFADKLRQLPGLVERGDFGRRVLQSRRDGRQARPPRSGGDLYPFSELLERVLFHLESSSVLGTVNPSYKIYLIPEKTKKELGHGHPCLNGWRQLDGQTQAGSRGVQRDDFYRSG